MTAAVPPQQSAAQGPPKANLPAQANNPYQRFVPAAEDLPRYENNRGLVRDVIFRNVKVSTAPLRGSILQGYSESRGISEHTCFCAIQPRATSTIRGAPPPRMLRAGGISPGVLSASSVRAKPDEGPRSRPPSTNWTACFPVVRAIEAWVPQRTLPRTQGREWIAIFRNLPQARVAG